VSGVANSFPFLYQGLEHEVSDPGQLYFEPSGNVYNPQLQRELSLIGPQGILGPPSGFGNGGFGSSRGHGSSAGGPSGLQTDLSDLGTVAIADVSLYLLGSPSSWLPFGFGETSGKLPIPLLGNLLCLIDCGSSNLDQPTRPPHETSQTYQILGIQLINGQRSAAGDMKNETRINPGDDPDLNLDKKLLDAEIRRLSALARSLPSGAERQKLQRKIDELRARKSKKAHQADKFNWIPIVPEAPLAADSSELPETVDILIEILELAL
jgi:hypothetical protein